jgi:ZIP family zinc transporter
VIVKKSFIMGKVIQGIMIPFLGTALGSACVLFMKKEMNTMIQRILLSFSAGAMIYVVVEELIPEMSQGQHSNLGTIFFTVGFTVMLALDVALG